MNSGMWFYAGWYGGLAAIALAARAARKWQHLIPHRHDGYVSVNGYVWPCAVCGSPPRDLEAQLAEVREYIAAHPWAGPYMGPGWEDGKHAVQAVRARRRWPVIMAVAALAVAAAGGLSSGLLTVHGWDWSAGTAASYCGVYLPHADAYCEHAR